MELRLPTTRAGWIGLGVAVAVVLAVLLLFTGVFKGHAVEVTVANATEQEIFGALDNTGRSGEHTEVISLPTSAGGKTPPGIRIPPGGLRSLGFAVGFFDSPTLHVWEVTGPGLADEARRYDCAFDTIDYRKLKLPSIHVRLKWNGHGCERDDSGP